MKPTLVAATKQQPLKATSAMPEIKRIGAIGRGG